MQSRCVLMFAVSLSLGGSSAFSDPPSTTAPSPLSAIDLRDALDLGPTELATLGVNLQAYHNIRDRIQQYLDQNRSTLAPLLEACGVAERELKSVRLRSLRSFTPSTESNEPLSNSELRALKLAECSAKEQALRVARSALRDACQTLRSEIGSHLTEQQRVLWARGIQNEGLEAALKFVELSSEQRSALLDAQQERDLTLYERATRQNMRAIRAASLAFEATLEELLTESQLEARSALQATRRENRQTESAITAADQAAS